MEISRWSSEARANTTGPRAKCECALEGAPDNRAIPAANFVAVCNPNNIPGASPPASGRWPFGPSSSLVRLNDWVNILIAGK